MSAPKKLTGRVPPELIKSMTIPRLPKKLLTGFAKLTDLTGAVSDGMDKLGLAGAIPGMVLRPNLPEKRVVGQAVTLRNVERPGTVSHNVALGTNKMGEQEAYNLAEPGDVVVIEGLTGVSNMGGQSATLAHRSKVAGAVIDGTYRDPDASREIGFPIWARGVTMITGKWRLQCAEINGTVRVAGVSVAAGDLVLADEAGVVFVPFEHAEAVLAEAQKIDAGDNASKGDIAKGVALTELAKRKYK